jgi:hypothetical protein
LLSPRFQDRVGLRVDPAGEKRDGKRRGMESPTSVTTENSQQPRRKGGADPRGTPTAATEVVDATYSDEQLSRGPWLGEPAPPTGVLTGVLGELAFYYGACCLYHRSAQRRGSSST